MTVLGIPWRGAIFNKQGEKQFVMARCLPGGELMKTGSLAHIRYGAGGKEYNPNSDLVRVIAGSPIVADKDIGRGASFKWVLEYGIEVLDAEIELAKGLE